MYFDESGLCRRMTGAAMRYELDELNTTGALTPLPIREGGAGTAR
jgi:hypothetical protein